MLKKRVITLAAGIALAAGSVAGTGALAAGPAAAATAHSRPALMGLRLVPARASNAPAGSYEIINEGQPLADMCLDAVSQHDGTNGDNVQLWHCNGGINQYWYLSLGGLSTIVNAAYGLCLDAVRQHDGTNGDNVQLWQCNGGSNQEWYSTFIEGSPTYFDNAAHLLCLDAVSQHDGTNGDNVQLWTCHSGSNQSWI